MDVDGLIVIFGTTNLKLLLAMLSMGLVSDLKSVGVLCSGMPTNIHPNR